MGRSAERERQSDDITLKILMDIEEAEDPRMAWGRVKSRIDTLRNTGRDVPDALVIAERQLMTELMAQSQGR